MMVQGDLLAKWLQSTDSVEKVGLSFHDRKVRPSLKFGAA
jgi:hypothetical protein